LHTEQETSPEKHTVDRVAAIVLLIITGVLALGLAFAGLMLIMSTDSCSNDCNTGVFTIAWLASMTFPIAGYVATLVYTFVQWGRGEGAAKVPVIGFVIYAAGFAASVAIAFAALN
jgi:hypothetical protein